MWRTVFLEMMFSWFGCIGSVEYISQLCYWYQRQIFKKIADSLTRLLLTPICLYIYKCELLTHNITRVINFKLSQCWTQCFDFYDSIIGIDSFPKIITCFSFTQPTNNQPTNKGTQNMIGKVKHVLMAV